jgi:hypothetical protein
LNTWLLLVGVGVVILMQAVAVLVALEQEQA